MKNQILKITRVNTFRVITCHCPALENPYFTEISAKGGVATHGELWKRSKHQGGWTEQHNLVVKKLSLMLGDGADVVEEK